MVHVLHVKRIVVHSWVLFLIRIYSTEAPNITRYLSITSNYGDFVSYLLSITILKNWDRIILFTTSDKINISHVYEGMEYDIFKIIKFSQHLIQHLSTTLNITNLVSSSSLGWLNHCITDSLSIIEHEQLFKITETIFNKMANSKGIHEIFPSFLLLLPPKVQLYWFTQQLFLPLPAL